MIIGEAEHFIAENPRVETLAPDRRAMVWQSRSEDGLHSFEQLSPAERGSDVGNLIAYDEVRAKRGGLTRTPAELAYERSDLELEIERCGDELRIRPAGRPITGALESLASFSPSFLAEGREQDEQQDRESL